MYTGHEGEDDDDNYVGDNNIDENRYIEKKDAKPNNQYHTQESACPNCGSYNTGQATYADYCNSCDWYTSY
jgi:hypothetical protein